MTLDEIEALVTHQLAVLDARRLQADQVSAEQVATAERLLYTYGLYCAQRADEAMRRKFERLPLTAPEEVPWLLT
jgi:hypothetical protein